MANGWLWSASANNLAASAAGRWLWPASMAGVSSAIESGGVSMASVAYTAQYQLIGVSLANIWLNNVISAAK